MYWSNNAGYHDFQKIKRFNTQEGFYRQFDINVRGIFISPLSGSGQQISRQGNI